VKVTSQPSLLELLCVDLCEVEDPKGVPHISAHANSVVQRLRSVGERRFLFTVNWRFPPRQFVIVFASPSPGAVGAAWPEGPGASSAAGELLRRFVEEMDDKERNLRFKMISWVPEGAWLVKTAIGKTPTLIGKALAIDYFHEPGYHFEVSVDVFSEPKAKSILGLVLGGAKALLVDMGLLIEGQAAGELPERLLGGFRIARINPGSCRGPI
jgi:hypothetical protein